VDYLNTDQVRKLKGILVYCRTRKISTDVFNFLTNSGFLAAMFHSGLEQKQKTQLLQDFRPGKVKVVVATIALGMGLDFENLDCVVHINMPKSVESYVQEMGRAGRRGKRAYCHMFLGKNDYFT
jgi:ATP-dependent DNA helicase Q4